MQSWVKMVIHLLWRSYISERLWGPNLPVLPKGHTDILLSVNYCLFIGNKLNYRIIIIKKELIEYCAKNIMYYLILKHIHKNQHGIFFILNLAI